jgi:V8-like Glu-specific endopeptidase
MSPMLRIKLMLASAFVLVAVSAAPGSAAGPVKIIGSSGGRSLTAAEQQRAIDYWTPSRMQNALPAVAPEPARRSPRNGLSDEVSSNPRLISSNGVESVGPTSGTTPTSYEYPFPFTGYPVETPLYTLAPYKAIGKIFFRQGSFNYVCSGASVVGGSLNVVFTAGHCVHSGAGNIDANFSRNVVFVPAYRNGARPFGTFAAGTLWTTSPWATSADLTYDMGAFNVGRNSAGKTLRSAVGKLGFAYNSGTRDLHWNSFGYPAAPPFTGGTLNVCQASHATDDLSLPGIGPDTLAIGCDMTGGSSGGPWVIRVKSGNYLSIPAGNYLNGLNSYGYPDAQPNAMYGPYFDVNANNLRCAAGTGNAAATTC